MKVGFWTVGVLMVACSSDKGVKVYNNDPEATITSHSEGAELFEAVEYTFTGQVSDGNHQNADLKVTWSAWQRELCPESNPDEEGRHAISLRVEDTTGKRQTETVAITVCSPNIESLWSITNPYNGSAYVVGQSVAFSGTATDDDINNS